MTHCSRLARYGVAVLVVGLMALVKVLMDPLSDQQLTPFLLFFAAVMVSALFGGLGPGLLTTFLAAVVSVYFFFPLRASSSCKTRDRCCGYSSS